MKCRFEGEGSTLQVLQDKLQQWPSVKNTTPRGGGGG